MRPCQDLDVSEHRQSMQSRLDLAKIGALAAIFVLTSGCSSTPPAIGMFADTGEVLHGTVGLEYNTYTKMFERAGAFDMRGTDSGLVCSGRIGITRAPLDAGQVPRDMTCKGQVGKVSAECADDRLLDAAWTADSCKSGFGEGRDSNGTAFAFTFGVPEQKALDRIERALGIHRQRPDWPGTERSR